MSVRRSARIVLLLCALGLEIVYLYSFPYIEKIHNANELPRIYLVQAIVERGVFHIDEGVRRYGYVVDTAGYGGHLYSNKAPGLSFAGVPVYAALRAIHRALERPPPGLREQTYALRVFCVTIPSLLFLLVFWRLTARMTDDPYARGLVTVGYALGTLALPFSLLYMSHQPAAICIAGVFALLAADATAHRLLAAGLLIGIAVLLDYQSVFFALPLAAYAIVRVRPRLRLSWIVAGGIPAIVALGAYHRACFGSPLRTGYAFSTFPLFQQFHSQGLLGLTRPTWQNFFEGFFALDNGLFVLSPWLLLGLAGVVVLLRRRERVREAILCAAMMAVAIAFLSSLVFARGGWQMGPRYIAIAVPFFALPAATAFQAAARSRLLAAGASALVVIAVVIYVGSSLVFPAWPDKLDNPVVELAYPLLRHGRAPYNLGHVLGLPPAVSLVPAFAIALALVLVPMRDHLVRLGAAVAGVALVAAFWLGPRTPGPDSRGVARWIESIWEPTEAATARPQSPTGAASPTSPEGRASVPPNLRSRPD